MDILIFKNKTQCFRYILKYKNNTAIRTKIRVNFILILKINSELNLTKKIAYINDKKHQYFFKLKKHVNIIF